MFVASSNDSCYIVDNKSRATKKEGGKQKDGSTLDPVTPREKHRRNPKE